MELKVRLNVHKNMGNIINDLKKFVPATIETGTAITVNNEHKNIRSAVIDTDDTFIKSSTIKQQADNIKLSVENFAENFSSGSFIDISNKKITFTSDTLMTRNNSGGLTAAIDSDGKLIVGSTKTKNNGNGYIIIKNGSIKVYNNDDKCNIEFGLDDNGFMVLKYYDNDGTLLYNLGPSGITTK